MKTIPLGSSELRTSRLAYGCMRIVGDGTPADRSKGKRAILAAVEAGYTLFDHADIYGGGTCEELFGEVLRETPGLREQIVIASKCGIRFEGDPDADAPARYDFSPEHIVHSVEGSLRRLGIEQLDLLLLHRPDYLMRADEVAEIFASLKSSGKVAHFGVSNFSVSQFDLLQSVLSDPLLVNQVEINIHNIDALSNGVLDQCQQKRHHAAGLVSDCRVSLIRRGAIPFRLRTKLASLRKLTVSQKSTEPRTGSLHLRGCSNTPPSFRQLSVQQPHRESPPRHRLSISVTAAKTGTGCSRHATGRQYPEL